MALDLQMLTREPKGIVKLVLILLSIITFATPISYESKCSNYPLRWDSFDHAEFFGVVFIALFIAESLCLMLYVFAMEYLMHFSAKIGVNWYLFEFVLSAIWAFFELLSSCMYSDGLAHAEKHYNGNGGSSCTFAGYKTGVGFGIISSFVMIFKCYLLFKAARNSGYQVGEGDVKDGYERVDGSTGLGSAGEVTVSV